MLRDLSLRHTAKALADGFGLSESGFKLYCQNVLGEGYLAYFRRRRLEKAAELLRTTTLRVQDIAAGVGYESQGKFAKALYNQFRLLPMECGRLAKLSAKPRHPGNRAAGLFGRRYRQVKVAMPYT